MKSKNLSQYMPSKYKELLDGIWRLNRVHNGPEQLLGMKRVLKFIQKNFKGDGTLHYLKTGETGNFWIVPDSMDSCEFCPDWTEWKCCCH